MKLKRIVIAVMAMVMMLCSTVMAAEGGKLDIKLTDTDLLPRSVKIQIIDTNTEQKYEVNLKRTNGYHQKISLPASDYRIDGTETKDYVLDDTSFDIAVGETTKISLDSQSTQGRSFSDGVIKMIRKNKTNILLLAIVAIGMAVVKKKEDNIKG